MNRPIWLGCLCLAIWILIPTGPGQAGDFLLVAQKTAEDLKQAQSDQARVQAEIVQARTKLQDRIAELTALRDEAKERLDLSEAGLKALVDQRTNLTRELADGQKGAREIRSLLTEYAGTLLEWSERSPAAVQDREFMAGLKALASGKTFPDLDRIRWLTDRSFDDLNRSASVETRLGDILTREGGQSPARVLFVGHLTATYDKDDQTGYLLPIPDSGRLLASGPPSWWIRGNIRDYMAGESEGLYLDVSGGAAIRQLAHQEALSTRIESGGLLVWPILLVGLAALVLVGERVFFLSRVRYNTDELMTRVTSLVNARDFEGAAKATEQQSGRPTSNVLLAGLVQKGQPREVIESSLSEAIIRETPRLERFIPALKVLAAVAPLLGLLGTVSGMINTFHVITLHGTGDPRLMAGGISQALVTTQLGLGVAIPVLVAAAMLNRRAQNLASDMEEKAMALLAALLRNQERTV